MNPLHFHLHLSKKKVKGHGNSKSGNLEGWQYLHHDRLTKVKDRHLVLLCWSKNTSFARECISSTPCLTLLLLCCPFLALPLHVCMPGDVSKLLMLSIYRKQALAIDMATIERNEIYCAVYLWFCCQLTCRKLCNMMSKHHLNTCIDSMSAVANGRYPNGSSMRVECI